MLICRDATSGRLGAPRTGTDGRHRVHFADTTVLMLRSRSRSVEPAWHARRTLDILRSDARSGRRWPARCLRAVIYRRVPVEQVPVLCGDVAPLRFVVADPARYGAEALERQHMP